MNSREILVKRLLSYWTYSKEKIKNTTGNIYPFSQTNLGATITGGVFGSVLTYSFGYSKLTQEKDQAVEALKRENETNAALKLQSINNQTIISSLTVQNAHLLDDKIIINNSNISIARKHDKSISDIKQIAVLHANSLFKPTIKSITNEYTAGPASEEVSNNRKEI